MAAKPPQVTVSCLSGTTKGRSPSGGFAIALWKPSPALFLIAQYPTLAGRGGSVSRRDLNQLAGIRAQLAWARKSKGKLKLIPSYSSGEGSGGRRFA